VQKRLGRDGRPFSCVKLRSLPTNVTVAANKYTIATAVTRWGRFLRLSHLDELPQCWLVVTGRMSLVGPRPELPELAATFDPAFVAERLAVRPGITGPWQVSTASAGLIGEAPELDRLYLTHAGPRLDAWVSLRTIGGFVGLRPLPLERFPRWVTNGSAPIGVRRAGIDGAAQTAKNQPVDAGRQTASSS
jgi:lipopolysaccharide/colanic/teichoic acid biosynthesis glycosyltransferase